MHSNFYPLFLLAFMKLALAAPAPGYWEVWEWCDPTCTPPNPSMGPPSGGPPGASSTGGPAPPGPSATINPGGPMMTTTAIAPPAGTGGPSNTGNGSSYAAPPPGGSQTGTGSTSQPTGPVAGTGQQLCSAEGQLADGSYTLMANIWGATPGQGASQCVQAAGTSGSGIAWTSKWSFSGGSTVKSFANANGNTESICKATNDIKSVPSTWNWSYDNSGIVADVAYDIFLGGTCNNPGGAHQYEIMLWLGIFGGQKPIGWNNGAGVGSVTVGGHTFTVYKGSNPSGQIQTVYSLLPSSNIQSFTGDLKDIFTQLTKMDPGVGTTSLVSIQAGTEAISGSATFSVSEYSISGT